MYRILKKFGYLSFFSYFYLLAVAGSALSYSILTALFGGYEDAGLLRAIIIPTVVSPPLGYFIIRLLARLERSEQRAQHNESRYRNILSSIMDGYFEIDLQGKIRFLNRAMAEILGLGETELLDSHTARFIADDEEPRIKAAFRHILQTGEAARQLSCSLLQADGSTVPVEISASLITGEAGEAEGFRGTVRDVSERRHMEERKKELENRLLLSKKMEAIGTMAGGVAHDLNNILTSIVSYPDLLLQTIAPSNGLHKPLTVIKKSGEKAAELVQDLLTLARRSITSGEPLNLNAIIEEYLDSHQFKELLLRHPGVQLRIDLAAALPNIRGSSHHIFKMLMNLVINAMEAMPEGGELTITTAPRPRQKAPAHASPTAADEAVSLVVKDTGIGIESYDQERIFEPFYSTKQLGRSGSGLGMAVVWGTVQDHGGSIEVDSAPGRGTAFTLSFPACRGEGKISPSKITAEIRGRGERLLLIDDAEEQRLIGSEILIALGYQVRSAASGEEAVRYYKTMDGEGRFPDLVLLDMIMEPGLDGLDTYRQILAINPAQKAIVVSGFSETERIRSTLQLGAGAFVRKPYLVEDLGLAVRRELDRQASLQ